MNAINTVFSLCIFYNKATEMRAIRKLLFPKHATWLCDFDNLKQLIKEVNASIMLPALHFFLGLLIRRPLLKITAWFFFLASNRHRQSYLGTLPRDSIFWFFPSIPSTFIISIWLYFSNQSLQETKINLN